MWAGPYNPMGSYNYQSHYADGTPIYENDFSTDQWPDSGSETRRWIYGELDLNKMVPPSASCMGAELPANNDVRADTSSSFSKVLNKPVVCEGMK